MRDEKVASEPGPRRPRRGAERPVAAAAGTTAKAKSGTVSLRIAESLGLLAGPKTKHLNAKVSPKLFQAAAERIGTTSPSAVINAALASLATEDQLGPWLAANTGIWADLDPELLARVELINDALTAILAHAGRFTIVTEDGDFDVLRQLVPGLDVLFYDRVTVR